MNVVIRRAAASLAAVTIAGAGLSFLAASPASAATLTVGPGQDYATIQAAINAASSGDTIDVAAGTYAQDLTIDKDVNLVGPNSGIDPNTGTRTAEAVITQPAVSDSPLVTYTTGGGGEITGFTLSDTVARTSVLPAISAPDSGTVADSWTYDIVTGNGEGIFFNTTASPQPTTITHDLFNANNNDPTSNTSGIAVYSPRIGGDSSQVADDVTVSADTFTDNANTASESGVVNTAGCVTTADCTGWSITDDTDTQGSTTANNFLVLLGLSDPTVTGNTVTFSDPTNAAVPAIYLDGGTHGGQISDNTISGDTNQAAIYLNNVYGSGGGGSLTIGGNTISGNQYGVWQADDGGPSLPAVSTVTINDNTISNSSVQGLDLVDANNDTVTANTLSNDGQGVGFTGGTGFSFSGNTVTATSAVADAFGVGVGGATNFTVSNNTFTNQGYGVNIFAGDGTSSGYTVSGNTVTGSSKTGIAVTASSGGTITDNTISGTATGQADATDHTAGSATAGTADTWTANNCATSAPGGLCLPTAPGTPVAEPGVESATVTWSDPGDGDQAITGFTVIATPGGATATAGPSATQAVVTGLAAGGSYTFTVVADNQQGASSPSAASNAVVPTAVPEEGVTSGSTSSSSQPATASTTNQDNGTTTSASATGGTGTVTVGYYGSAPVPSSGFTNGAYFDVQIAPGSTFTSVTITLCGVTSAQTLQWWNATAGAWQLVSPAPVASDGCDTFTVTASSSPDVNDLVGTIFSAVVLPGGYDLVGSDGGVFVFPEGAPSGYYGSLPGLGITVHNIVGIVPSSDNKGYFLVGSDGGVFSFGDTTYEGSLPGLNISVNDIKGIVPTSDDKGYFLVGADGGVFSFGDAPYLGSLPGDHISVDNIVGIAATPNDQGYWLVSSTGAVYAFGDASYYGGATPGTSTVAGIATTPSGLGYWIVFANGGVQDFGNAKNFGSLPSIGVTPAHPVVALVPTADSQGYWLIGADGGVFSFGDASVQGSLPGLGISVTDIVGAVPTST